MSSFTLSNVPVDPAQLREKLEHPGSGGYCSFEGWVRNSNEGREVSGLEYEAYVELAQLEGERLVAEAMQRYGVLAAQCLHRTGDLKIGELAVWIGVSAAHRDEAFRACRYIIDEIKHRLPIWKKEHYLEGDTAWVACSHTERAHEHESAPDHHHQHDPVTPAHPQKGTSPENVADPEMGTRPETGTGEKGTGDEDARRETTQAFTPDYSRQTRLRDVGEAGQAKLRAARVLVIGAGGLGVPVLTYLAGAGVGTLGIVDDDTLDASNLHRQVMYSAAEVGGKKVELARRRVVALNPDVSVQTYEKRLDANDIVEVFGQYDLIVECTDDLRSRYLSSDAAVVTGTPLILASVYQYEGQLQVITGQPGDPCLRCLWPDEPAPELAGSCVESGVLGPVPGVLGTLQASEALKLLLGLPQPDTHPLVLINLLDLTMQQLPVRADLGCCSHGGCVAVAQQALSTAREQGDIELIFHRLEDALAAGYTLIDVRESDEIADDPLGVPAQHVPSGDIAAHAGELTDANVLLVCASGRRSDHAARTLRGLGVRHAHSLAGGRAALHAATAG